jgi:hypothetical protein
VRDLRVARDLGISPRRFWGWEPETTFVYDGDRLVGSVVEPEFDDEQRQLLIALAEYEASLNEYGIPISEATAVGAQPGNPEWTHRFEAESLIDWSADAVDQHLKSKLVDGKDPYSGSRKIRVRRVDR